MIPRSARAVNGTGVFFVFLAIRQAQGYNRASATHTEVNRAMERLLLLEENTRLTDIMDAYPWLKGEAIALDERFRLLDSPLARILLKKATILDASKRTGYPVQEIIAEINKMVDRHIA